VNSRTKAYINLLITYSIWGISGPIIKFTLNKVDPINFLAYRFLITGFISIFIFFHNKHYLKEIKKHFIKLTLASIIMYPLALGLLFVGLSKATVLDLTLINILSPLLVGLGGAIFLHEHITHKEKIGTTIAVIGVIIANIFPIIFIGNGYKLSGNIFLIGFILADTAGILLGKMLLKHKISPQVVSNYGLFVAMLVIVPIAIYQNGSQNLISEFINIDFKYQLAILYIGIMAGTIAHFLMTKAVKTIEASEAILFKYLDPIFAIPLAVLWLNEKVSLWFFIGSIFILTGVYIAEKKK